MRAHRACRRGRPRRSLPPRRARARHGPCRPRRVRSRGSRSSADDDAIDRRQVGANLDLRVAGGADKLRDLDGLSGTDLQRDRGRPLRQCRQLFEQHHDRLQAGRARHQGVSRLVLADLGRQLIPFGLGDIREVREEQIEGTPVGLGSPSESTPRRTTSTRSARPRRSTFVWATLTASKEMSVATTRDSRKLVGDRQGDRATAGADVEDILRLQLQRDLDEQLGLRPRDQDPPVDDQLDPPESLAAQDVGHRLAPDAAADRLREPA